MLQNYTFPIKYTSKNYTFPMFSEAKNYTFPMFSGKNDSTLCAYPINYFLFVSK